MSPSPTKKASPKSQMKSKCKTDDWSEVTEPEERRRIQNRIAQREKAREQKERAAREAQNFEFADSAYRVPAADELAGDEGEGLGMSGLPWGGLSVCYVVARGHECAGSQQGSRRTSENQRADDGATTTHLDSPAGGLPPQHAGGYEHSSIAGLYDQSTAYQYDCGAGWDARAGPACLGR